MSKEYFESLERLAMPDELHIEECKRAGIGLTKDYKVVKEALKRLESIDNTNPSEALECLDNLENSLSLANELLKVTDTSAMDKYITTIKQALLKAQENEKVLKIIKEKPQAELSLIQLGKIKTYEEYLEYTRVWDLEYWDMVYEEEEFDLIKRVEE